MAVSVFSSDENNSFFAVANRNRMQQPVVGYLSFEVTESNVSKNQRK